MAMPMPQKPAIVIIPGSFSPSSLYSSIIDQLSYYGYDALAIDLPSIGRFQKPHPATMNEDAAHIQSITTKLADQGKDVMLVMHSYGGVPGTESTKGLSKIDRQASGKIGGISRLLYMSAVVVPVGCSLRNLTGPTPDHVIVKDGYMYTDPYVVGGQVFSDLPEPDAVKWMSKMIEHSNISYDGELTYAPYKQIPVTYVVLEDDQLIPASVQRAMADTIAKESDDIDIRSLRSGHVPNVTSPEALVHLLRKCAGENI